MNPTSLKIRKAYDAEFGDWCYDKSKKKEVMLLKEACEQIDYTSRLNDKYWMEIKELRQKVRDLEYTLKEGKQ